MIEIVRFFVDTNQVFVDTDQVFIDTSSLVLCIDWIFHRIYQENVAINKNIRNTHVFVNLFMMTIFIKLKVYFVLPLKTG